jgi:hypothetical protein
MEDLKIKDLSIYHTNDFKQEVQSGALLAPAFDPKQKLPGTLMSPDDFNISWKRSEAYNCININDRVISSAGNGYAYGVPSNSEFVQMHGLVGAKKSEIIQGIEEARANSMKENSRTRPAAKDVEAAILFGQEAYQDLGLYFKFFNIN